MRNVMGLTEKQLGGWSLLIGAAAIAVAYVLSPGRGAIDTVPSTNLTDLTLAMGRNEALSYSLPILIIPGALLMLNGLLAARRHASPVARLGLTAMVAALIIQMVLRGFDYTLTGLGAAALNDAAREEELLRSALTIQRLVYGLNFTSSVSGFIGLAIMAVGLAFHPEPVRLPPALNVIVAVLAIAALVVFISAWHSNALELAFAPVFVAMSLSGIVYMALLGRGLIISKDDVD